MSVSGDMLMLVNPNAFDADPDIIAAAAAAVEHPDWAKEFRFDRNFWSHDSKDPDRFFVDQEYVYNSIGPGIVERTFKGVSSSCFAYGHTGTGKTHTMFGSLAIQESSSGYVATNSSHSGSFAFRNSNVGTGSAGVMSAMENKGYGLVPRVFVDICNRLLTDSDVCADALVSVTISFVEIYNEKIRDLLCPIVQDGGGADLKVREHPQHGPYVENLSKVEVITPSDVTALLSSALSRRVVTHTHRVCNN